MTIIAAAVFIFTAVRATLYSPQAEVAPPPAIHANLKGELLSRLLIPSIGVDAKIQKVGIAKSGNMGVPTNFTDVGWYKYGPVPGETGSAVIDGHLDNAISLPGVFKNLSNVKIGDSIFVEDASSTRIEFLVRDVQSYRYDEVPLELLFHRNDGRYLNLVTCAGSWIQSAKNYEERIIVFAELK
jgi:LPXTG-site transpeptidase (sortase) family protein